MTNSDRWVDSWSLVMTLKYGYKKQQRMGRTLKTMRKRILVICPTDVEFVFIS